MSAIDWSELDGYEALVTELRASPPVVPERLRQRILEGAPDGRRRMSSKRRLAFVVVPVAVALAVGAALVHGLVNSGPKRTYANEPAFAVSHGSAAKASTATTPSATERVLAPARPKALTHLNAARNSVVIPRDRLVHADASLQVQVPNRSALSKTTNEATQIVSSLGGYAQSVQYQSETKGGGSSFLALKVPVGKAQTAIGRLAQLGTLVSQQVSTQDLQQTLTRQTNGIGTLRRAIAVYEQALKTPLTASQRIEIQIKLANARHSVKVLRKARAGTVASGAAADISLTLTTSKSSIVGGGSHTSGRFDRLLGGAAGFLALEGIIVLYALVVLSPLLVIGGLAWVFLRERRRRDERRLLAST